MEQVTLDWFTTQEVSRKRKIIAKTIESLSATESSLLLPQIPFEATAASTSEVASVPDTARRTTKSAAVLPDPFKV